MTILNTYRQAIQMAQIKYFVTTKFSFSSFAAAVTHSLISANELSGLTAFFTAKLTFAFRQTSLNFFVPRLLGFYDGRCQLQGAKTYRTMLKPGLDNLGLFYALR